MAPPGDTGASTGVSMGASDAAAHEGDVDTTNRLLYVVVKVAETL